MARIEARLRRRGRLREGLIERATPAGRGERRRPMTPLALFLLACARGARRHRVGRLQRDDAAVAAPDGRAQRPRRPARALSRRPDAAVHPGADRAGHHLRRGRRAAGPGASAMQAGHGLPTLIAAMAVFALVCEHLVPLVLIRRDPEGVLAATLPAFHAVERVLRPVTLALLRRRPAAGAGDRQRRGRQRRRPAAAGEAARRRWRPRRRRRARSGRARCCARSSTSATRWCAR